MNPPNNIGKATNGSDEKLKGRFGKDMPFKVPNAYFENLPERVLDACKQSGHPSEKRFFQKVVFIRIATAAAILIFATLILTMVFNNPQSNDDLFTDYDIEEVYLYNINNLSDLEESYLLSLVNDIDENSYFYEIETDSVPSDIIVEYLLAENHIEYLASTDY